jgi:hypothetical protein
LSATINNNPVSTKYFNYILCIWGFAPNPARPVRRAHFILCLNTKNEARKIKPKRPLTRSVARQEFQAKRASLLAEIPCLTTLFTPFIIFKGVHELLRKFTATPAPRFGTASPQSFE